MEVLKTTQVVLGLLTLAVMLISIFDRYKNEDNLDNEVRTKNLIVGVIVLCFLTSLSFAVSGNIVLTLIWCFNGFLWFQIRKTVNNTFDNLKMKAYQDMRNLDNRVAEELDEWGDPKQEFTSNDNYSK
jgi:hypothetical protein